MKIRFFRTSAKILAAAIFLASCQTTYIPENDFDVAPEFFYQNEWNKTLLEAVRNNYYNLAKECLEKKLPKCIYSKLLALGGKNKTQMMSALRNEDFSYAIKQGAKSSNGVLCSLYVKKARELLTYY